MTGEHILVVDDEPDLVELVAVNLRFEGYRVSIANDGQQALAVVAQEVPDLLLLDVMMPRLDGWGVLGALQEDPDTRDVPVVMLTALAGERDLIQGHLSGAVSYVTKPFDVRGLLACVAEALTPETEEQRRDRSRRIRDMLTRLAELEADRPAGPAVRFSRIEPRRRPPAPTRAADAPARALSPRQREVAGLLAAGWEARQIAGRLGTSRSNIYAIRKRIAQRLGVAPDEVADEARRLGLADAGGTRG